MSPASRPPHADGGRMLAENKRSPATFSEFINLAPLKRLDFLEVNMPKQVGLKCGGVERWLHRDSVPRSTMTRSQIDCAPASANHDTLHRPKEGWQVRMRSGKPGACSGAPRDENVRAIVPARGDLGSILAGTEEIHAGDATQGTQVWPSVESLMKCTLPSPNSAFTPPGW